MSDTEPVLFESPQEQVEQAIFDYRQLSAEKREFVLQKTDETQWLLKKTAENIIKIGKNLREVKAALPRGQFLSWLSSEFSMSQQTSSNFMRVAETFEDKLLNFSNLSVSALYLFSSSNTPQSAIDEAIQLAESGKKVTHAMAQKLIQAEKAKEEAERKAAEALADAEIAQQKLFGVQNEANTKITALSEQITALQQDMTTLATPPTEYVDKVVWPEEKVKELGRLREKVSVLSASLEEEKESVPQSVQREMATLKKQLETFREKYRQQEEANQSHQERINNLDGQLKIAIRDRITSENDERIRQEWRHIVSETHSCMMRLLGQWPTPLDIRSFEADDWTRLDQLKSTLRRVLEECDNLHYRGDDMIVDMNPHALRMLDEV